MDECADEARAFERDQWLNTPMSEKIQYKNAQLERLSYDKELSSKYDNSAWKDRNGKITNFFDMDGFHLLNIKAFILKKNNMGLNHKLPYVNLALNKLGYTVEDYRKDCEKLMKKDFDDGVF